MSNSRKSHENSPSRKEEEFSFLEIWQTLLRQKVLVGICVLLGIVPTVLYHYSFPSYVVKSSLLLQRAENSPLQAVFANVMGGGFNSGAGGTDHLSPYFTYLESTQFYEELVKGLKSNPEKLHRISQGIPLMNANSTPDELAKLLESHISIGRNKSEMILITAKTRAKEASVELANLVASIAHEKIRESDSAQTEAAKTYIQKQLDEISAHLKATGTEVVEFKRGADLLSIGLEDNQFGLKILELQKELEENRIRFEQNQKLIELLTREMASQDSSESGKSSLGLASNLRRKLDALQYQQSQMALQGHAEDSSVVRDIHRDIDATKLQLKALESQSPKVDDSLIDLLNQSGGPSKTLGQLKAQSKDLSIRIETIKKLLSEVVHTKKANLSDDQKMQGLKRKMGLEYALYEELRRKFFEVEIQQISLGSRFRILETATLPGVSRTISLRVKTAIALVLSSMFGVLIALGRDLINPAVKGRSDLENAGLVFAGNVPQVQKRRGQANDTKVPLVLLDRWDSAESMAFKHIRVLLLKRMRTALKDGVEIPDGPRRGKMIAILSAKSGDGKTMISTNLALCISQPGVKVLLMDCDLRKPNTSDRFGLRNHQGVGHIINGRKTIDECIVPNAVPGLDILPAGEFSRETAELLAGDRFRELVNELKQRYDYVVVDTPPLLPVVDGTWIASLADLPLLSVRNGVTKKADVVRAVDKLDENVHPYVFAVLNGTHDLDQYAYVYTAASADREREQKARDVAAVKDGASNPQRGSLTV